VTVRKVGRPTVRIRPNPVSELGVRSYYVGNDAVSESPRCTSDTALRPEGLRASATRKQGIAKSPPGPNAHVCTSRGCSANRNNSKGVTR
jgi:hypothetical protein